MPALTAPGTTLLGNVTLAAAAAQIDFVSIPQIYAHLMLVAQLNTDTAPATTDVYAQYNGDAGPNYYGQTMYATGTTSPPGTYAYEALIKVIIGTCSGIGVNYLQGAVVLFIPNYTRADAGHPSIGFSAGQASGTLWMRSDLTSGFWSRTEAINRLTVLGNGFVPTRQPSDALRPQIGEPRDVRPRQLRLRY